MTLSARFQILQAMTEGQPRSPRLTSLTATLRLFTIVQKQAYKARACIGGLIAQLGEDTPEYALNCYNALVELEQQFPVEGSLEQVTNEVGIPTHDIE